MRLTRQAWQRASIAAMALAVAVAVTVAAGWHLPAPHPDAPPMVDAPQAVFGYATLANPLVRWAVIGRPVPARSATLAGLARDGRNLRVAPGAEVSGRVFTVTPRGLARLDRYERAGKRYYRTLTPLDDGTPAWVYRLIERDTPAPVSMVD